MLSAGSRQAGVTLVELMIASSIALFALAALLTAYGATVRHGSTQLRQADLHQQAQAALQLMSRDLRRSGYWHFEPRSHAPEDNPFTRPERDLRTGAYAGEAADSCVLFAYDLDRDGRVGIGRCPGGGCPPDSDDDNLEQFGYRLRDGRLQARYGGDRPGCDSGYWQAVTDTGIEITQLHFIPHVACTNLDDVQQACRPGDPQLIRRAIEIRLRVRLRGGAGELALSTWTRVRNDQLRAGTP